MRMLVVPQQACSCSSTAATGSGSAQRVTHILSWHLPHYHHRGEHYNGKRECQIRLRESVISRQGLWSTPQSSGISTHIKPNLTPFFTRTVHECTVSSSICTWGMYEYLQYDISVWHIQLHKISSVKAHIAFKQRCRCMCVCRYYCMKYRVSSFGV